MKNDVYQSSFETIQNALDKDWYDSTYSKSIQAKSESLMIRFIIESI